MFLNYNMINFNIYKPGDKSINFQNLSHLLFDAFTERTNQGLFFSCANLSAQEIEEHLKDKLLFTLEDGNVVKAMMTLSVKGNHGHVEYVAVSPNEKHTGLATKLFVKMEKYAYDNGVCYLTSTTACKAISSVKWHKKNGFLIYGMGSDVHTNYYSYLFIKANKGIWTNKLFVKFVFFFYYIGIKLGKKENGELTGIGVLIKKIKNLF